MHFPSFSDLFVLKGGPKTFAIKSYILFCEQLILIIKDEGQLVILLEELKLKLI